MDPRSTCSRAVLTVLNERGVEYELHVVNLGKRDQMTPQHMAMQPFGKVPVLVDGDRTLFESKAIMKYVDRTFPGPKLTPSDPWGSYQMENWLSIYDSYYAPKMHVICFELVLKKRYKGTANDKGDPDPEKAEKAAKELESVLDVMDKHLSKNEFLAGTTFSIADAAYLARLKYTETAGHAHLRTARENLNRWWMSCSNHPSYKQIETYKLDPPLQIMGSVVGHR